MSNSSSSSFVIDRDCLSNNQVKIIQDHIVASKMYDPPDEDWGWGNDPGDAWTITVTDNEVAGFTSMDNFDMRHFLGEIGVDSNDISWSY